METLQTVAKARKYSDKAYLNGFGAYYTRDELFHLTIDLMNETVHLESDCKKAHAYARAMKANEDYKMETYGFCFGVAMKAIYHLDGFELLKLDFYLRAYKEALKIQTVEGVNLSMFMLTAIAYDNLLKNVESERKSIDHSFVCSKVETVQPLNIVNVLYTVGALVLVLLTLKECIQ